MKIREQLREAMKEKWLYDFSCLNPTDYECRIYFNIRGEIMEKLFHKSLVAVQKRLNTKLDKKVPELDTFDLDPRYLNIVWSNIRKWVKVIGDRCKRDGIVLVDFRPVRGYYERTGDTWLFNLLFVGQYVDKR